MSDRTKVKRVKPPKTKAGATGFIGVTVHYKQWIARITKDNVTYRLGPFDSPVAAAIARNAKAFELWGSGAVLNEIVLGFTPGQ